MTPSKALGFKSSWDDADWAVGACWLIFDTWHLQETAAAAETWCELPVLVSSCSTPSRLSFGGIHLYGLSNDKHSSQSLYEAALSAQYYSYQYCQISRLMSCSEEDYESSECWSGLAPQDPQRRLYFDETWAMHVQDERLYWLFERAVGPDTGNWEDHTQPWANVLN